MAVRSFEALPVAVAMDDQGIIPERLEAAFSAQPRLKLFYTVPDYQNPTGITMSGERRQAVVEACRRHHVLIVEDVTYRELYFDGPPPASLWSAAPDVVLQIGTFSKTFFPGVRLGWAVGPAEVVEQMVIAKQNTDQCAGALGQRLMEVFGRSGGLDQQITVARRIYGQRRDLMMDALAASMPEGVRWTRPGGGFVTWLTLTGGIDSSALAAAAARHQVAFVPGGAFYVDASEGAGHLRLSFSSVPTGQVQEGVRRLAGVIRDSGSHGGDL
jgi:2-aminoadipate transaminase